MVIVTGIEIGGGLGTDVGMAPRGSAPFGVEAAAAWGGGGGVATAGGVGEVDGWPEGTVEVVAAAVALGCAVADPRGERGEVAVGLRLGVLLKQATRLGK